MNNNEEIEFLDVPVTEANAASSIENIPNQQPKVNNQINSNTNNQVQEVVNNVSEENIQQPHTQQIIMEPITNNEDKPKMMINPANNIISESQPSTSILNVDNEVYDDDQLVGKQEETEFKDVEIVKDSSLIKPSIFMFLIFGLMEFIIGPRFILKYAVKLATEIFGKLPEPTTLDATLSYIKIYFVIIAILIIGLLTYFLVMFVYSIINLVVKGEYYDKLKTAIKSMLGYSFAFAAIIVLALMIFKIDLVTPVVKVVTFNGLLFKYYF